MVINVQKEIIMKKTYMQPELKVVVIKRSHVLLGASVGVETGKSLGDEFEDDDITY